MNSPARASLAESLAFTGLHVLPNVLRGLFVRTRIRTRLRAWFPDAAGEWLFARLRRRHGGRPVLIRMGLRQVLLPTLQQDFDAVLDDSPLVYAEPAAKRKGMAHFQPGALTISRGTDWRAKRARNESVLGSKGLPAEHARQVGAIVQAETLPRCGAATFAHADVAAVFDRVAQRIVLGGDAAEPMARLRALMRRANWLVALGSGKRRREFLAWLGTWSPPAGTPCLGASMLDGCRAVSPDEVASSPRSQLPHLLFAIGDTLAENCTQALCAILAHADARERATAEAKAWAPGGEAPYLDACFREAMRLWTSTPMLMREALSADKLGGSMLEPGRQVVLWTSALHRDPGAYHAADRFVPERFVGANPLPEYALSGGGQSCAGRALCLTLARAFLATVLRRDGLRLTAPKLAPPRMPPLCDFFALRVTT